MAGSKKKSKQVLNELERLARYEDAKRKKVKRRNLITIVACTVAAFAVLATMAVVAVQLNRPADEAADTKTDSSDINEPTNKSDQTNEDGMPIVTFDDGGKPSIEFPSNYEKPTALEQKVLEEGTGEEVAASDTISALYTGWMIDGKQFDSSYDRGEPTEFPLSNVVSGWTQGLSGKKVGDVVELVIPSALGYGENGNPQGDIPPNADLVFVVKIVSKK